MAVRTTVASIALGLSVLMLPSMSAMAREGGGSDNGDGYLNDAQKNPRFIEPYADADPSRYRISNPQYGYGDRERAAAYGYYGPRPYSGRIEVQPYGPAFRR